MNNIAFCFIVKDGEKYLEKNINKIINLGNSYFKNYRIYYAENDSKDNTINILQKYKQKYTNIYGIHLKIDGLYSTDLCKNKNKNKIIYNCSKRLRRLAYLRNIVLNQIKLWFECNYVITLDLDFIDFDKNEFINMFNIINNNSNIDGIFGMSIDQNNYLYDLAAIKPFYKIINIINRYKLIKVKSAFSGFGIYRMNSIRYINYNTKTNSIEHIDFNKKIKNLYVYSYFNPKYKNIKSYYLFFHQIKIIFSLLILIILIILIKIL